MRIGLYLLGCSVLVASIVACGDDDSGETSTTSGAESDMGTEEATDDVDESDVEEPEATEEATDETAATEEATDETEAETEEPEPAEETDEGTSDGGAEGPESVVLMSEEGENSIEITFSEDGTECGEALCRNAEIEGFPVGVEGCCFDEGESMCGFDMTVLGLALDLSDPGCEPLDAPGNLDTNCPDSEPISVLLPNAPPEGVVMDGCCQASGECGFSADFGGFGFGCVGPERFDQGSTGDCEPEL